MNAVLIFPDWIYPDNPDTTLESVPRIDAKVAEYFGAIVMNVVRVLLGIVISFVRIVIISVLFMQ